MKTLPSLFLVFALLSASDAGAANLRQVFSRTLILGASVSRGYATEGPGTRAAKRFGGKVENLAEDEAPASDFDEEITQEFLAPYTAVIAIDFLFWDSGNVFFNGQSKGKFDELVEAAAERGIPLVVGDIPQLINWQLSRDTLNRHIYATCKPEKRCYVLPFNQLHAQAKGEGLVIRGKRYTFEELADDGLHLNEIGSEYIADRIIGLLK